MLAGLLLSFREGLEAALILGTIFGVLSKLGKQQLRKFIWLGAIFAIVISALAGFIIFAVGASFEGRAEEIFEGIAMLMAAGILTWAIVWMQSHARSLNKKLESGTEKAVKKNNVIALFLLAFMAVFREGIELALFLIAAANHADEANVFVGATLGLVLAAIFSVLLFNSLIRLNISKFFRVTSIILVIFAAGLVAHGVHELNEANLIPSIIEHVWDINHILDENSTTGELLKTLIGYNGNPSLTEIIAYGLYYVLVFSIIPNIKKTDDLKKQTAK